MSKELSKLKNELDKLSGLIVGSNILQSPLGFWERYDAWREAVKGLESAIREMEEKMERLTHERVNGIKTGYWSPEKKETLVNALAEYENTGLTPEEIKMLIGTVEECRKSVKEEDVLKFYYCESEDNYYIGKRVGNFYYARYGETGFEWFMSRYLPWGEHVIAPNTVWKEYTYPSEPKEIPFFEWLQGFIKRYCGGTAEECREAMEKQKPKKEAGSRTRAKSRCAGREGAGQ